MAAALASNSTTLLVSMMSRINLRLMGKSRKGLMSVLFPRAFAPHDLGHPEQLGADLQLCPLGGVGIDLETDLAVLVLRKIDHATLLDKSLHLANRQCVRSTLPRQDLREVFFLG